MEAAARLMFGDVESKRLMSALWRARDREEGAGGASTPTLGSRGSPRPSLDGMETDSAGATRRGPGVGQLPALRRLPEASCNSWDWVDPAPESPSEMRSDARAEDVSSPGDAETQSKVFRVASMKMLRSVDEDGDERLLRHMAGVAIILTIRGQSPVAATTTAWRTPRPEGSSCRSTRRSSARRGSTARSMACWSSALHWPR